MNRRSVLRWLGLAPVAAHAAVAAAYAAQAAPAATTVVYRHRLGKVFMEALSDGRSRIVVDAPSLDLDAARRREMEARIQADEAFAADLRGDLSRIGQAEARIISEQSVRAIAPAGVCLTGLLTTRIG